MTWSGLLIGMFIHAHLVLVKLHKLRFTLVPALLFVAMISSNYVIVAVSVIATGLRSPA